MRTTIVMILNQTQTWSLFLLRDRAQPPLLTTGYNVQLTQVRNDMCRMHVNILSVDPASSSYGTGLPKILNLTYQTSAQSRK